jgi:hypothetical protein
MIRRLEKQQRSSADDVGSKLSKLREDLEYVRVSSLQYTTLMTRIIATFVCVIFLLSEPACIFS